MTRECVACSPEANWKSVGSGFMSQGRGVDCVNTDAAESVCPSSVMRLR